MFEFNWTSRPPTLSSSLRSDFSMNFSDSEMTQILSSESGYLFGKTNNFHEAMISFSLEIQFSSLRLIFNENICHFLKAPSFPKKTKSEKQFSAWLDLHLIFEKSSLQNQVGRTWFLVYIQLDFYCLCSLQNSSSK